MNNYREVRGNKKIVNSEQLIVNREETNLKSQTSNSKPLNLLTFDLVVFGVSQDDNSVIQSKRSLRRNPK